MKRLPPRSFWTVEDLAAELRTSCDAIHIYAADSLLTLTTRHLDGLDRLGVTAAEKDRFESAAGDASCDEYTTKERRTHLYLIGALASLWCIGELKRPNSHYEIRDLVAGDANAKGYGMLRGRETDANAIRAGLDLFLAQEGAASSISLATRRSAA